MAVLGFLMFIAASLVIFFTPDSMFREVKDDTFDEFYEDDEDDYSIPMDENYSEPKPTRQLPPGYEYVRNPEFISFEQANHYGIPYWVAKKVKH